MTEPEGKPVDHDPADFIGQEEPVKEETGPKLSRRQILAPPILAAAPNITQGAQDAGISEATLRRWRREPHFRAEMDRLTHEIAETTRQGLQSLIVDGLDTINNMMKDPDPMVRLRAAQVAVILGIRVCNAEEYRLGSQTAQGGAPGEADKSASWTNLSD